MLYLIGILLKSMISLILNWRSEEHTSELQSRPHLVCRLLLENALPHWDFDKKYDFIDFELGVKITGVGFFVYKGKGVRLQRALINKKSYSCYFYSQFKINEIILFSKIPMR